MTAYDSLYALNDPNTIPESITGLRKLLQSTPENSRARAYLSHAYTLGGDFDLAAELIEKGLLANPHDTSLQTAIERLLMFAQQDTDRAAAGRIAERLLPYVDR